MDSKPDYRCKKRALHRQLNQRNITEFEIAFADGTWFSNTKLSAGHSLLMTYCWSQGFSYAQTIQECRFEDDKVCEVTVADWYSYFREVCMLSLETLYERPGRIGCSGHVVENEIRHG